MMEYIDISVLNPAEYNPRLLTPEAQENLKKSIIELGIIKPIIIRRSDNRIMAGHQRTKTMKLLGYTHVPAFILDGVNSTDEVRFNQLHNYAECEVSEIQPDIHVALPAGAEGFFTVPNKDITLITKGGNNSRVVDLTKMILRYGQFANAVCDHTGKVIISTVYAKTVKLLGMDLLVYVLPEGKDELALSYFSKEYGVFEYSHLERKTYIQSFAQKARLRQKNGVPSSRSHSTLYESLVIPNITKETRVLDFGAGQKDYATMLQKKGYRIDAIEFFHRKDGADIIDEKEIRQDCTALCRTLSEYGLYDVVVCDSVLNSVNSLEDEKNVLLTLSALCKPGGKIFWSGIPLLFAQKSSERKETHDYRSKAVFLDANNFTANFRFGEWYFQHYHSTADVVRLNKAYIGDTFEIFERGVPVGQERELRGSSFQVMTVNERKAKKEDYMKALQAEFTLPLPNNRRWDLDKDILPIFEKL